EALACCVVFWHLVGAPDEEEIATGWHIVPLNSARPDVARLDADERLHQAAFLRAFGQRYMDEGRYLDAAIYLRSAATLAPDDEKIMQFLATSLIHAGRWDDANRLLTACTVRFPENTLLLIAKAEVQVHRRELRAAKKTLENALTLSPRDSTATALLATVSNKLSAENQGPVEAR